MYNKSNIRFATSPYIGNTRFRYQRLCGTMVQHYYRRRGVYIFCSGHCSENSNQHCKSVHKAYNSINPFRFIPF